MISTQEDLLPPESRASERPTTPSHPILDDMVASQGDPRDLAATQITELRAALLADLFLFATVVFGYRDMWAPFHRELAALIGAWGQPGYRRLMIQVPRGTFKSSLGTIANSLWQVCRDPDAPVAIFNEKEGNSEMFVRAVRETVENSIVFQTIFADLLPPGIGRRDKERGITMPRSWKWTDSELLFQRGVYGIPEPSIMGLGIGSASAGRHFPKIIKDDIIGKAAKDSILVMENTRDWLKNSFSLERPALGGQDLILCTPWGYEDVYATALRDYDYKLYRRSIYDGPGGSILTPNLFTAETLAKMQQADPEVFAAQQMCRPRPGKDVAFEFSWLRFGEVRCDQFVIEADSFDRGINPAGVPELPERRVNLSAMEKCILVDPIPDSETEKRLEPGCQHAALLVAKDYWGRKYLLDLHLSRSDPYDLILAIIDMCKRWGNDRVGIENVAFSVIYRHWLAREYPRHGIEHLTLVDLKPGRRQKDARIRAKIPAVRSGHYYLARGVTEPFVRQYLEYPYGLRDALDAWAYDEEPGALPRPLSPQEQQWYEDQYDRSARLRAGADPITGYGMCLPMTLLQTSLPVGNTDTLTSCDNAVVADGSSGALIFALLATTMFVRITSPLRRLER